MAIALTAVVVAGVWGIGLFGQLSEGGYTDPGSESTRAADLVRDAAGAQLGDVVVIYTPTSGTIDDPMLRQRVENRMNALPKNKVSAWTSYWNDRATQYAAADKSSAVVVLDLAGTDDGAKLKAFRGIKDRLGVEDARSQVAGAAALGDTSATRSNKDLGIAEAVSLPIVLILLLFIFGSLVAAALPVLIGGCAVLGSMGVLHAIALHQEVNSFAVNVASLLGLGMAIDYGLFMVGRFREEQSFGRPPAEAVRRTVATAGRTVVLSATLLMIALAGLLLFPQGYLKSLAYGGLAAVALAAVLSLTLLPAVLTVLGPRVDKMPVRLARRRRDRPDGTGWARLSDVVLRFPDVIVVALLAGLLVLAAPIRGVHFADTDERVLPSSEPARQAIETLKSDFPALSSVGIQVALRGTRGAAPTAAAGRAFAASIEKVPGIAGAGPTGSGDDVLVLTATLRSEDPFSTSAREAVRGIRALPAPPDTEVLVGGTTARNVDSLDATAARLPLMIGLLVGATLVLMFLAFGSILLPIKAVLASALSLSATLGSLVWIFQEGHGAGLLHITPAPLEVGIVVLMAAVVFGLSTDYEVFLLSRMVEARTRGASTAEAVTTGLARTGRVISAAAVLLIVVTGAFALSAVTTMRFVGVGMIIALLLDATIVRMLLVPAMLSLLGSAAWWAPGPLRRLQQRAGLAEYADEELFPTVSVGRHAAPDDAAPDGASPAATSAPGREDVAADLPTTSAPDEAGKARSPASGSSGSPTAPAPEPTGKASSPASVSSDPPTAPAPEPTGKASSPASGSSGSPSAPAPEPTGKASRAPASAASGGEPSPVPATTGDDQPEPPTEPAAEPATATATPAADEDGVGDPYQAVEIGATEPPTGNTGAAAASDDLQAPTVNLAPHLNAEPKQTAADTAVLEFQPTVDLVARLGSAPDDSRPCS
jgi:RND superfamily putative drug exporter